MDEKLLSKLLHERKEKDSLEFKAKLKLYDADGKLAPQQRDEFLKDILGLANGNSHIIRKTKYLIIGADDKKFDDGGCRALYCVDYKVPTSDDISRWLAEACTPAIVGLECEKVPFQGTDLFIITIQPTFNLHETTRELNASGHFQKHTVFMRQDSNTVPASVRDGIAIQQLKQLHRQEISNPSAIWIGAVAGCIVAFITASAKVKSASPALTYSETFIQTFFVVLGILLGGFTGWMARQWNEIRYDWRYQTLRKKIIMVCFVLFMFIAYWVIFR